MNDIESDEKKRTVVIGEHFCQYRERTYSETWKRIREEASAVSREETGHYDYNGLVCPLCNVTFEVGQVVFLVMNNHRMFPNCVIHKECAANGNETDNDMMETTEKLMQSHASFKECIEKNRSWL